MVVICSTMMINTACERLLMSFILVVAVARLSAPFCMRLYISLGERTAHSESPSTNTPFFLSSLIYREVRSIFSRSEITSL